MVDPTPPPPATLTAYAAAMNAAAALTRARQVVDEPGGKLQQVNNYLAIAEGWRQLADTIAARPVIQPPKPLDDDEPRRYTRT